MMIENDDFACLRANSLMSALDELRNTTIPFSMK